MGLRKRAQVLTSKPSSSLVGAVSWLNTSFSRALRAKYTRAQGWLVSFTRRVRMS